MQTFIRPKPIGITPERVTEIQIQSKELPSGTTKRRKALAPRPRRWAWKHDGTIKPQEKTR